MSRRLVIAAVLGTVVLIQCWLFYVNRHLFIDFKRDRHGGNDTVSTFVNHFTADLTTATQPPPTTPPFRRRNPNKTMVAWKTHHQHDGFTWEKHAQQWQEIVNGDVNFTEEEVCGDYPPGSWTGPNASSSPNIDRPRGIWPGVQVYGSRRAQWEIYRHQHPESCKDQRYLIIKALGHHEGHGIGSAIHITTAQLLYGFMTNRIVISEPQPTHLWMGGEFCKNHTTWDSCYFLPLSNCTLKDTDMDPNSIPSLHHFFAFEPNFNHTHRVVYGFYSAEIRDPLLQIPDFAKPFMEHSGLDRSTWFYWWRSQATAYLLRPNQRTREALWKLRRETFPRGTIPPGTINIHVRRGNKWKEAKLPSSESYVELLNDMVRKYSGDNRQLLDTRRVFLSTESNNTLVFFQNLTGWDLLYVETHRYEGNTQYGAEASPMNHATDIGVDKEMLNSLLNLELSLECDAWICLFESNWCRLIDEVRSTVRCKAHMPFSAIGMQPRITDYGW